MDAVFNDRKEVWPVNLPGRGAIADFPEVNVSNIRRTVGAVAYVALAARTS